VFERWSEVFDDFHAEVLELIDEGDWVAVAVRWKGRSRDTGLAVEWLGADVARVEQGMVVHAESGFPDTATALQDVRARRA
jgi:ketosteroid isomerase-like protein